jgi:hypothetical protein
MRGWPLLRTARRPRGAALIAALVALTIVASLATMMTQSFVALERENRAAMRSMQAGFLVESGLERGAASLARNPEYTGETWELAPPDSGLAVPATVVIRVVHEMDRRSLAVEARYGADQAQQAAARRTVWLAPSKTTNTSR